MLLGTRLFFIGVINKGTNQLVFIEDKHIFWQGRLDKNFPNIWVGDKAWVVVTLFSVSPISNLLFWSKRNEQPLLKIISRCPTLINNPYAILFQMIHFIFNTYLGFISATQLAARFVIILERVCVALSFLLGGHFLCPQDTYPPFDHGLRPIPFQLLFF